MPESDDNAKGRRDVLTVLLTAKVQESRELLGHYIRAFTIYAGITGAVLTCALNDKATTELRLSLFAFGGALNVLGFGVCFMGESLRRSVVRDIDALRSRQ
jgi:hypothetical protein